MELMQIMMSKIKRTEARCAIFEKESREKVQIFYFKILILVIIVIIFNLGFKNSKFRIKIGKSTKNK